MKCKDIWNIILQKWDETGTEVDFSVTSFTEQKSAEETFGKWMEEDRENPGFEKSPGRKEYYYDNENEKGFSRVLLINSKLY